MQIGELIRGFPEPSTANRPVKGEGVSPSLQILPIRESDKPYQFDFPKFDSNDIQNAIGRSLREAVLGKLFQTNSKLGAGLYDGFNENAAPIGTIPTEPPPLEKSPEESVISLYYNYSFSESLRLEFTYSNNQLALDLSYSGSFFEQTSYTNSNQGIEYSSESTFEKSLSLSVQVDFDENGVAPSLVRYDLDQSSASSFSESFSISKRSVIDVPIKAQPQNILNIRTSEEPSFGTLSTGLRLGLTESLSSQPAPIELIQSKQSRADQQLLFSQLRSALFDSLDLESKLLSPAEGASNSVIQAYLLGLR